MECWLYLSGVMHGTCILYLESVFCFFFMHCEFYGVFVILSQGEALFQTHENLEHLAMMERVLGPLPQHMLKRVE